MCGKKSIIMNLWDYTLLTVEHFVEINSKTLGVTMRCMPITSCTRHLAQAKDNMLCLQVGTMIKWRSNVWLHNIFSVSHDCTWNLT